MFAQICEMIWSLDESALVAKFRPTLQILGNWRWQIFSENFLVYDSIESEEINMFDILSRFYFEINQNKNKIVIMT